jgi:menaquinone-specific isochorismate synthase
MNPADTAAIAQARVLAVTAPAAGADPIRFLRRAGRGPRGFWARSDGWIVHSGALATVTAEGTHPEGSFTEIETNASDLFASGSVLGVGAAAGVRFFGGFAFRPEYATEELWAGFPPALFHVPALELESVSGADPVLTVRILVDPERDGAQSTLTRLLTHAERLSRELADPATDVSADSRGPVASPTRPISFTRTESERAGWDAAVREALAAIDEGRVSKVVLARTLDVITESRLDPIEVAHQLWAENVGSHVFYFDPEDGCVLLGAAPETVTTLSGGQFRATAVAGTVARGETEREQKRLADQLLASDKEGVEQRIALEDMVARLGPLAEEIRTQPEPHVLTLARLQHLETEIRARLPEGTSALKVLEALHPTPAVCGLPRDAALALLDEEEPFERGWYAGPVGWFDLDGSGVFVPALRCAVVRDLRWRLFAGAGIVKGSDPGLEWDETNIKFEPMLRALAASGAR